MTSGINSILPTTGMALAVAAVGAAGNLALKNACVYGAFHLSLSSESLEELPKWKTIPIAIVLKVNPTTKQALLNGAALSVFILLAIPIMIQKLGLR